MDRSPEERDERLRALLQQYPRPEPPAELRGRVLGEIARRRAARGPRRWLVPAAALAVGLLAVRLAPREPVIVSDDLRAARFVAVHAAAAPASPWVDTTALELLAAEVGGR